MYTLLIHPSLADCRRLFLRNHELWITIGVHEYEKRAEQRVFINVDLFVPLTISTPAQGESVVDYDFIRHAIEQRIQQGRIDYQETLCDDVLALMLAHKHVRAARVSTEKPDVYADCDAVGCEVFRIKSSS